jgi:hypothetical protein
MKLLLLISSISFFVACKNEPKVTTENVTPSMLSSTNCYRLTNNKDTLILKTSLVNDTVSGTLSYNYYQKDKSHGKIEGLMKGDLIIADYIFFSEGVQSIREVAFKKIGDNFIEGYGEVEEKDGKTIFKNPNSLTFNQAVVLTKIDCEK